MSSSLNASSIGSKQGAFKEENAISDGYIYNHSNQRRMLTAGIYRCFIPTPHKAAHRGSPGDYAIRACFR